MWEENNRCTGAKMTCCRWERRSWIYCKLSALLAIFCKAFQPVTPSNHKVRNSWVAMTLYFLGQGINCRTVANQFGVALPTVCRIVHKKNKGVVQYFDKFMHSIVLYYIHITIDEEYNTIQNDATTIEYNAMLCINLSEYWTSMKNKSHCW